jgi:hypothetical protein
MSYVSRAIALLEGELGRVSTAGERQRLLDAYALLTPNNSGQPLTNEQIAKTYVTRHLQLDLDQINFKEGADAAAGTVAANKAQFADSGT